MWEGGEPKRYVIQPGTLIAQVADQFIFDALAASGNYNLFPQLWRCVLMGSGLIMKRRDEDYSCWRLSSGSMSGVDAVQTWPVQLHHMAGAAEGLRDGRLLTIAEAQPTDIGAL